MLEFSILGQSTSLLEIAGLITGIASVWLTVRQNILCFPIGIINVLIYAFLFSSNGIRLYADAFLQIVYLILLIYGWIRWKKNKIEINFPISINSFFLTRLLVFCIPSFFILGLFLAYFTNASLPWLDALLTVISLAAQWMIAKKMIENWALWIVVNIIYVPMYIYKGLHLTSILYFIFLLLAFKGLSEWKKLSTNTHIT